MKLRPRPPPRGIFFALIQVTCDPKDQERIGFAYTCSKYGHALQKRDDGTRYFDHPKAATWIYIDELGGRDPRIICDILLHDVVEDAYLLTLYRLKVNFGIDIALDVHALTKLPDGKETLEEYLRRIIARGPWAIVAKLCDRLHNLRTLGSRPKKKRLETVAETRKYHLKLLLPALRGHGESWSACADLLEQKIKDAIAELPKR